MKHPTRRTTNLKLGAASLLGLFLASNSMAQHHAGDAQDIREPQKHLHRTFASRRNTTRHTLNARPPMPTLPRAFIGVTPIYTPVTPPMPA
jgi:hypothetical protein